MSLCLCVVSSAAEGEPVSERLDNGLRVLMVEDHAVPLVSVQLWLAAGAGVDNPEEPGIAVIARCALADRDEGDLRLRAAGARSVSRTTFDATCFAATIRPEMLDVALDVQRARLESRSLGDRDVMRAVRSAKIAPAAALMSDYGGAMWIGEAVEAARAVDPVAAALRAALYPGQPCGHDANFVAATIAERVRAADLDEFAGRWFVSGNATLFVIGDITPADVLERVKRRFAALPWKEPPRRPEYPSAEPAVVRMRVETGGAEGMEFAWSVMPWGYAENAALDVLTRVLCDPIEGALTGRLREIGLPAPHVRREAWRDDGMLTISFDARPSESGKVENAVRESLREIAERGPTPVALNRARRQVTRAIADVRSSFADRAERLAAQEIIGGDIMLDRFEPSAVARVSHGAVKRAAAMLAERRRVVLARAAPESGPRPTATAAAEAGVEWLDAAEALATLDRAATQSIPAPPAVLVSATTPLVVNGVTLRLHTSVKGERIAIVATAPVEDVSPTAAAARLLAGTDSLRDRKLNNYLAYHAITLRAGGWTDSAAARRSGVLLEATCERDQLAPVIEILGDIMRRPAPPEDSLRNAMWYTTAVALGRAASAADWMDWLLDAAGCTTSAVAAVPTKADIRRAAELLANTQDVQLDVVGDVAAEEAVSAVREFWPVPLPTTRSATPPALASTQPAATMRAIWSPGDAASIEAAFVVPLAAIPNAGGSHFDAACAAWLLGAPHAAFAKIDRARRWRWRCEVASGRLTAAASLTAADAMPCLKRMASRVRQLTEGRIPQHERDQARRLAATSSVLSLHDIRGVRAWLPLPPVFAASAGMSDRGGLRVPITLIVVGGPPALARELEVEFGTVERVARPRD